VPRYSSLQDGERELPRHVPVKMPSVSLKDVVTGEVVDVSALSAGKKGTVVAFICNHCPYVVHIRGARARGA